MRCSVCGSVMKEVTGVITETVRGVPTTVDDVHQYACDACGEIELDLDDADRLSREQMKQVTKAKGILSPDEIRGIRKGLGLTQEEFQRLLGVSSPPVSRWEMGVMLPSKTTDNLMRVIAEVPEAVAFLMDREPGMEFRVSITAENSMPQDVPT